MPCGNFVAGIAGETAAGRLMCGHPCWTGRQLGESEGGCRGGSLAWLWLGFGCASVRVVGNLGDAGTWWVNQRASRRGMIGAHSGGEKGGR